MEDRSLVEQFGATIRRLRRNAGLSQEDFADLCQLHRTYVGSIERGEKAVTMVTASKLAKALNLTLAQLFQEMERETQAKDDRE